MPQRQAFFTALPGPVRDELWCPAAQQRAAELGFDVRLNPLKHKPSTAEWAELLAEVEALITTWGTPRLDSAVLAANRGLRIVGHAAGSVAGIVSDELHERGVRVVTANAEMARSVAEWGLMMTLTAARRLLRYAKFGEAGELHPELRALAKSPYDLVIGFWGYGDISRRLIEMLRPFEPKAMLIASNHLSAVDAEAEGLRKVELDELFATSGVIHVLTGLTATNKGRIAGELLGSIQDGAALINAGRAALIDEHALLAELRKNRFTYIADVHYHEPPADDDPILRLPNVIMTPHCAGRTSRSRYIKLVLEEFDRFYRGEPLQHEITRGRAAQMTDARLTK